MDICTGSAYLARVDGRGIATNVYNKVSNPFASHESRVDRESEVLMPSRETADGIVKEARYLTSDGRQINRATYDKQTGACTEVQVERWSAAPQGGLIRRLYAMSMPCLTSVAGAMGGPAAGCGITQYYKSTDFFATDLSASHNIGRHIVTVDQDSHEASLNSTGLLWYGTDGEHEADHQAVINLVPAKETEREAWFLSQGQ